MMTLILSCIPPPDDVENVVAQFLRKNAPSEIAHNCRCALYYLMVASGGAKTVVPSVDEIRAIASGFPRIHFDERFGSDDIIAVKESVVAAPEEVYSPPVAATLVVKPPPPVLAASSNNSTSSNSAAPHNEPIIQKTVISAPLAPPPPPPPPPEPPKRKARALYAYTPDSPEKNELVEGEEYEVLIESDSGWWNVKNKAGKSGWAPSSYMAF